MVEIDERIYESDVLRVVAGLRLADRHEIWAMTRQHPLLAVVNSINSTDRPYVARVDGQAEALFGAVTPALGDVATPWFLGTDAVEANALALVRGTREFAAFLLQRYRTLRNYVHVEHTASIRYLKASGFRFGEPVLMSTGAYAREFRMERPDNV